MNRTGQTDLATLLRQMRPVLHPDPYVFCTLDVSDFARLPGSLLSVAVGLFRETEGVTVILPAPEAERAGLAFDELWAQITLSVHSDLLAVGFLAALATRLAADNISVNAVSAVFHDHLFVPFTERDRAVANLAALADMA